MNSFMNFISFSSKIMEWKKLLQVDWLTDFPTLIKIKIANQSIKTRNYKVNAKSFPATHGSLFRMNEHSKVEERGGRNLITMATAPQPFHRRSQHFFGCQEQESDNKSLKLVVLKNHCQRERLLTCGAHELCLTFINRRRKLHENFVIGRRFECMHFAFDFHYETFSIASTPLLSSMSRGDLCPLAIVN